MKSYQYYLSLLLISIFSLALQAQNSPPSQVAITLNPSDSIFLGKPINLQITAKYPSKYTIEFPKIPPIMDSLEVLSTQAVTTASLNDTTLIAQQQVTITSFKPGPQVVPAFRFNYTNTTTGQTGILVSQAQKINILEPAVDPQNEIRNVKDPIALPYTWRELLPYIIAAILGILLLIWLLKRLRTKKQQTTSAQQEPYPQAPPQPPHEIALQKLQQLQQNGLWHNIGTKNYYSQLTDILREYIQGRYQINAPELTTTETTYRLRRHKLEKTLHDHLNNTLTLADLVKFAKATPTETENNASFNFAKHFVEQTKQQNNTPTISQ